MAKDKLYFASLKECNENCLFCVKGGENEPTRYLNTAESKKAILKAAKEGWEHIFFDGGEPTIRPDLIELITFAKESGFRKVTLLTNAVKLSDESYAGEIMKVAQKPNFNFNFSISLHSHKKEISEYLVGKKETFDKTIKGIENIARMGGNISIYHIICRYNFKDLPGFVDFLKKKFPKTRNICFSFIYPEGAARENKHIFPKLSKVDPYLQKALKKTEESEMTFTIATCGILPLCYLRGYEIYTINQQKNEKPENVKIIDSAKEENFILATQKFHEKTKVKNSRCGLCLLDKMCSGIWNFYAGIHGVDELKPITEKSSFKSIKINLSLIDEIKDEIKDFQDIFLVDFDLTEINEKNAKDIEEMIDWMRQLELNYIVSTPLPCIKDGKRLNIPQNCFDCHKLFNVKDNKVIFCDGTRGLNIDKYQSRKDLFKEAKDKSAFSKECSVRTEF